MTNRRSEGSIDYLTPYMSSQRFAGDSDILDRLKTLKDLRSEGSIDYSTPYMSSQQSPTYGSGGGSYFDYIEGKRKELDDIVNSDGGPWKEPDETVDSVDPDPDPVTPDPEPEIDPERKAAQDKWRKIFANHIEEGKSIGRSEIDSMDNAVRYSKTMTPEENREYKWAFEETTNAPDWSKWGGGNKKGSGGGGFNRSAGNRNQANNKSTKGGTTAPGGQNAGAMRSDIQLKENITYINTSPEGHSIYEWNYKGEPESRRYQGVMAQELLETTPHAVVTMDDGYLGVKYDEIDVKFTTA